LPLLKQLAERDEKVLFLLLVDLSFPSQSNYALLKKNTPKMLFLIYYIFLLVLLTKKFSFHLISNF